MTLYRETQEWCVVLPVLFLKLLLLLLFQILVVVVVVESGVLLLLLLPTVPCSVLVLAGEVACKCVGEQCQLLIFGLVQDIIYVRSTIATTMYSNSAQQPRRNNDCTLSNHHNTISSRLYT